MRHSERVGVARIAGVTLFLDAFVLLDGFIRSRLYRGQPQNPNFRIGYAIDRFRGKWELRIGIPVALRTPSPRHAYVPFQRAPIMHSGGRAREHRRRN